MRNEKGQFVKGSVSLNKGRIVTDEVRKKISKSLIGKFRGNKASNYKGGRVYQMGYICILCPDHPKIKNKKNVRYMGEHILIVEKKLGRYLEKGECVHHINGIKDDNRIENLIVMTESQHNIHHLKLRKHKQFFTKEILEFEYEKNVKTMKEIAKKYNCSKELVRYYLIKYDIKTRSKNRWKREY